MNYIVYIIYLGLSALLAYISQDIRVKGNAYKYIGISKERFEKLSNSKDVGMALGKIPMTLSVIAAFSVVLHMLVGYIAFFLLVIMLIVIGYIWYNSVKSIRNKVN